MTLQDLEFLTLLVVAVSFFGVWCAYHGRRLGLFLTWGAWVVMLLGNLAYWAANP